MGPPHVKPVCTGKGVNVIGVNVICAEHACVACKCMTSNFALGEQSMDAVHLLRLCHPLKRDISSQNAVSL